MSYREKESIVNIFSGILITAIFAWVVYQRHLAGDFDLINDYSQWGTILLYFMGISVAARIVIYIIFNIFNVIATGEEELPVTDERDKLINLKGTRNAYYTFSVGMLLGFLSLAVGMPVFTVFGAFIISALLGEIVENCTKICLYRKGV